MIASTKGSVKGLEELPDKVGKKERDNKREKGKIVDQFQKFNIQLVGRKREKRY